MKETVEVPPKLAVKLITFRTQTTTYTKLTSFVLFSLPRTRAGTETRPYDFG